MQFFSLRIAVSFSFSPAPPFQWGGSIEEGVLMERSQARQIRGGGGRESTVGWTALSLSLGSAWCLAKLTEPILSGCHCNINTHLEQMWLKAWNIEQTAATDPVPLHEHLCSINAARSRGREGSLYSPQFFGRWVKRQHCGDAVLTLRSTSGCTARRAQRPPGPFTPHCSNSSFYIAISFLLQIYSYREMITFFLIFSLYVVLHISPQETDSKMGQ